MVVGCRIVKCIWLIWLVGYFTAKCNTLYQPCDILTVKYVTMILDSIFFMTSSWKLNCFYLKVFPLIIRSFRNTLIVRLGKIEKDKTGYTRNSISWIRQNQCWSLGSRQCHPNTKWTIRERHWNEPHSVPTKQTHSIPPRFSRWMHLHVDDCMY